MSARKPRGTRVDPVGLGWAVESEAKQAFQVIAARANMSAAELFELTTANMLIHLNEQGLPDWLPVRARDGELPIDSA